MNGLETAIRNALARTPDADAEQRERIYQSARLAVDKSLQKQGADDAATLESQRARVEAVIAEIEAEYAGGAPSQAAAGEVVQREEPRVAPPASEERIPPVEPRNVRDAAPSDLDFVADGRADLERGDELSPVIDASDRLGASPAAAPGATPLLQREKWSRPSRKERRRAAREREEKPRRRGGGFRSFLIQLAVLVALVGAGLWWISANGGVEEVGRRLADSGAELLGGGPDDSVFQPAQRVGAGQFSGDWITVLSPGEFDTVEGGDGVVLEEIEEGEADALRITSVGIGQAGEARIPLGEEARAAMQSGRAVIALTVSTSGDQPTQISVRCTFAGAEECARQRFDVLFERNDIIFDVNLAGGPSGEDAALLVNSDISGEGRSIDLFAVRVQPAPR